MLSSVKLAVQSAAMHAASLLCTWVYRRPTCLLRHACGGPRRMQAAVHAHRTHCMPALSNTQRLTLMLKSSSHLPSRKSTTTNGMSVIYSPIYSPSSGPAWSSAFSMQAQDIKGWWGWLASNAPWQHAQELPLQTAEAQALIWGNVFCSHYNVVLSSLCRAVWL